MSFSLSNSGTSVFAGTPQAIQPIQDVRSFLQVNQRLQLALNVTPVELATLPDQNVLDVHPVLAAIRKGFEDDQVFSRTGEQADVRSKWKESSAPDGGLFERQGAERKVDSDPGLRPQQQHPSLERKLCRILDAGIEALQKSANHFGFPAETREHI